MREFARILLSSLSPFSFFFFFYRAFSSHSARAEEIASGNGRGNSFRVGKVGAARPPPNGNPSCDGVRSHATISHWKLCECASSVLACVRISAPRGIINVQFVCVQAASLHSHQSERGEAEAGPGPEWRRGYDPVDVSVSVARRYSR